MKDWLEKIEGISNNMMDKNTKNCNLIKRIKDIILTIVALCIAESVADHFLNGAFVWTVIIMFVVLLLFIPLDVWCNKKIEDHFTKIG